MDIDERIEDLLAAKVNEELSPEEERELAGWLEASEVNRQWLQRTEEVQARLRTLRNDTPLDAPARLKKVKTRVHFHAVRRALRYASLLLLPVGALAFYLAREGQESTEVPERAFAAIAEPGQDRAMLVLSDGRQVTLDMTMRDTVVLAGEEVTLKVDPSRMLRYEASPTTATVEALPLRLVIPRGGEYRIVLEDGTTVWLNSATTLEFPRQFASNERRVKLSGEAYFQVERDPARPFVVDVADLSVRVLGTRFNLMAYPDENRVLTTLVSGSVEVNTNEGARVVLEPDQQAAVLGGEINVSPVDASYITSWVQGKFNFDNATLEEIAMQISRWYDVKILFAKEELKSLHFSGSMQKFRPLEHLIQRIEATGDVRCRVKGGDIVIDNK